MTEAIFEDLLARYALDPNLPVTLPGDDAEGRAVLDAAKVAIVAALDRNDIARADQCVAFARALAEHTGRPDYLAWAQWCQGLRLLNYKPHEALTHLNAARAYYHEAGRSEEEGRVLVGYAFVLSLAGRLEEAA